MKTNAITKLEVREDLYNQLNAILTAPNIRIHVNEIAKIREKLFDDEDIEDIEHMNITNRIRCKIQEEALSAVERNQGYGGVYMATGTGKTKVAIDKIARLVAEGYDGKIIIIVPTIKLRDENWKDEFNKWGKLDLYNDHVTKICYDSMHKLVGGKYYVVLDEGHNVTESNETFFRDNQITGLLVLTATRPANFHKIDIFKRLEIRPVYELTMPDSIKLGISSPYEITVITVPMDKVDKYVKSGNATKGYFYQTEQEKYNYLAKRALMVGGKLNLLNRMKFIKVLRSKTRAAVNMLSHIIPQDVRTLIFCGGIEQAIEVCDRRYFSKPSCKPTDPIDKRDRVARILEHYEKDRGYDDFKAGNINRLSCVESINEGHNLGDIDCLFIVQLSRQQLHFVQRAGRIRFRPNITGKIIVLVADGTIDVEWASRAMRGFDHNKIKWVTLEDVRTFKYVINFKEREREDGDVESQVMAMYKETVLDNL